MCSVGANVDMWVGMWVEWGCVNGVWVDDKKLYNVGFDDGLAEIRDGGWATGNEIINNVDDTGWGAVGDVWLLGM